MPIYEYSCEKCHQKEEVLQKVGEKAPEECSHCHAQGSLKKNVTTSAFHLKGGGWYKDLYASTKKDSGDAAKSANTPEGTDAKVSPPKKED